MIEQRMDLWTAFLSTVAAGPGRPAILQGKFAITFAGLEERARSLAAGYLAAGIGPGDRIVVGMAPSAETAAVLLAVWAVGGIAVILDRAELPTYLAYAVAKVEPSLVVIREEDTDRVPPIPTPILNPEASRHAPTSALPRRTRLPTEPASIVFTSGSTGTPKGVVQSTGSLMRACTVVGGYLGLRPDDRILCPVPWSFDYGYGNLLSTILLGPAHVLPEGQGAFPICAAIERHRVTVFAGMYSIFTWLLRGLSSFRTVDRSSLRILTNTGGTIPKPVLFEMFDLMPDTRIFLNYGLTESYRTAYLDPDLARERYDSLGRGIPGVEVIVVREDGTVADSGEMGEIVHRGDYLCSGYWRDPEATGRALRPDPLVSAAIPVRPRVLFTGDQGMIDGDGFLYFHGRRDNLLKCQGFRVNPGEVERLLYDSGLITEVAVFGRPSQMMGDEIWACVVPNKTGLDTAKQLADFAREKLPPYLRPAKILLRDSLPRTRSGKTDYTALRRESEVGGSNPPTAPTRT